MRSKRVILHRAAFALVALVAVAVVGGCSSVEPADAWTEATGRVAGTVRTDGGELLEGIEVCLWIDGAETWYETVTDENGAYEIDGVEMSSQHAFLTTYWIGANRVPDRSTSINEDYASCRENIDVLKDATTEWNTVIEYIGLPDDPESYIDD